MAKTREKPRRDSSVPLSVRLPAKNAPKLRDVPLPPPLPIRGDIVDLLLEERQGRR